MVVVKEDKLDPYLGAHQWFSDGPGFLILSLFNISAVLLPTSSQQHACECQAAFSSQMKSVALDEIYSNTL